MTALPNALHPLTTGVTYNTRGVVGDQGIITTQYLEQEQLLHSLFGDLVFYNEDWYVTVDIPEKMNEKVHWEIDERQAGNAVYQIGEQGLQVGSVYNSLGVAQTLNAEVPGMTIGQTYVEASPLRYASIAYYTAVSRSVSKRDQKVRLENEMGKVIAEQLDTLAKGAFDQHAQDVYPRADVTTDNLIEATDYFSLAFLIKLEVYVRNAQLHPPKQGGNFPLIVDFGAQAGLLLDPMTARVLEATANRGNEMAEIFKAKFIGSLRCFDIFSSNRLTATTNTLGVDVGAGYIISREAVASLAMMSDEYGQRAQANANSGPMASERDFKEEMPRPVKVYDHAPGSGALGADPFKNRGAIAEVHTLGLHVLRAGWLIKCHFASSGAAGDIGISATAGTAGAVVHTAA